MYPNINLSVLSCTIELFEHKIIISSTRVRVRGNSESEKKCMYIYI